MSHPQQLEKAYRIMFNQSDELHSFCYVPHTFQSRRLDRFRDRNLYPMSTSFVNRTFPPLGWMH